MAGRRKDKDAARQRKSSISSNRRRGRPLQCTVLMHGTKNPLRPTPKKRWQHQRQRQQGCNGAVTALTKMLRLCPTLPNRDARCQLLSPVSRRHIAPHLWEVLTLSSTLPAPQKPMRLYGDATPCTRKGLFAPRGLQASVPQSFVSLSRAYPLTIMRTYLAPREPIVLGSHVPCARAHLTRAASHVSSAKAFTVGSLPSVNAPLEASSLRKRKCVLLYIC